MLGIFFAVKTAKDAANPDQRRTVARAAKVLSRIQHSQMVKLLEHRLEEAVPYVVLENLPGGNLRQHVGGFNDDEMRHSQAGGQGATNDSGRTS